MYFALERVKKITNEIQNYVHSNKIDIEKLLMKEGNFPSISEAEKSCTPWQEYTCGDRWGGCDSHAWFRAAVRIPESFAGKTAALYVSTGDTGWDALNPQFILYIDGMLVQGLDVNHREVIITGQAEPGREYLVDLHAYGGRIDKKTQLYVSLVAADKEIRRLYYNLKTPVGILEKLAHGDKRYVDMITVLTETINLLDLRKPFSPQFYSSVDAANAYVEKELYGRLCGHEDVIATCVGHTHIDVAWLWTLSQTREKVARSFSTVLNLMEQYPDYIFMSSQPQLYKYIKEDHPDVYEKIKQRIKEGRWEVEGAMWLEADCNVTSGESLVRQILYGTRFFEKEFGVKNRVLWLPDVFGYSAALPQILKKSDIDYFMTTKISWNQFNKVPYDTFNWEGIDGTEVLTYFITTRDPDYPPNSHFTTYNGHIHPGAIIGAWERFQQKELTNDVLVCFGYGDGGGGPTIEMLETAQRLDKGMPGCPRVKMGKAGDFFENLESRVKDNKRLPRWVGELYLEYHRGTYTSMARNKRYNRKSELLYQDAEFLSSMAMSLGYDYPMEKLNIGWETILLNQFHDILPGSSIKEVYEDSKVQYEKTLSDGRDIADKSLGSLIENIKIDKPSVVVLNTLSFRRGDIAAFDVPDYIEQPCVVGQDGVKSVCQIIDNGASRRAIFYAKDIPSKGYRVYSIEEYGKSEKSAEVSENRLENRYFIIEIDEKGTFKSFYDKLNKREVLKKGERGNMLQAFEDKPMNYDNWDIDIYYQEKMWEVDEVESVEVIERGPVRSGIRVTKKFLDSRIIQNIYIYSDMPRVDFDTYADWKESQVLLKAAFPVDVHSDKAAYEIQFGNIERPTHWNTSWDAARFEVCAHKWADLSEDGYGVSLMNDCKYGHDIKDGVMRLTLLKSGIYPNKDADKEEHRFIYSVYPHSSGWKAAGTVKMAYSLNVPLYTRVEEPHDGMLPQVLSMLGIDSENVIVDTVKKAEDSDDIIIRVYECHNRRSSVNIKFYKKLKEVTECSLMEKDLSPVQISGGEFGFEIKPYEIKTFKLKI